MIIEAQPGWLALQPACDDADTNITPGREPDPLEIESRDCHWCGLLIDRHRMVDNGDGPEFWCLDLSADEMTLPELERRAELRFQEGVAAIMARMDAMPRPRDPPPAMPEPYRPAQSTVDAFFYLVGLDDPERLKVWLADHPRDAPILFNLLENKQC